MLSSMHLARQYNYNQRVAKTHKFKRKYDITFYSLDFKNTAAFAF